CWRAQINTTTGKVPVRMLSQRIAISGGQDCMALWDTGSQATLVTSDFARRARLEQVETEGLCLIGLGEVSSERSNTAFKVPLVTSEGKVKEIEAHALDFITSPLEPVDMGEMIDNFPEVTRDDIEDDQGPVDMLIGMDAASLFPAKVRTEGKTALYSSEFGTNWLMAGRQQPSDSGYADVMMTVRKETSERAAKARPAMTEEKLLQPSCRAVEHFVPHNFIAAEAMGTDMPRRCTSCKNCKECQFKMDALTFNEN
ncbi:MAG: hypothetical protein AN484_27275, partial [Aphanizomenon flos-aquae WA102]